MSTENLYQFMQGICSCLMPVDPQKESILAITFSAGKPKLLQRMRYLPWTVTGGNRGDVEWEPYETGAPTRTVYVKCPRSQIEAIEEYTRNLLGKKQKQTRKISLRRAA